MDEDKKVNRHLK